ncbi:MAG: sigma 54-interacting transcriptional regulator [Acidobacteriota bacterium]
MSVRRTRRQTKPQLSLSLSDLGWDAATVALFDHCSLPWHSQLPSNSVSLAAESLAELRPGDKRKSLSLLGQYCAHQAFLRFCGFTDRSFDAQEWAVAWTRGQDPRLIRVTGAGLANQAESNLPGLALIEEFADWAEIDHLECLKEPWGKPEAVYAEVDERIHGIRESRFWLRAASHGSLGVPGIETLRDLLAGKSRSAACAGEVEMLRTGNRLAALLPESVVVMGESASPLRQFSSVRTFEPIVGPLGKRSAAAYAEVVAERAERTPLLVIVVREERFDSKSREFLKILKNQSRCSWLLHGNEAVSPATSADTQRLRGRTFVLSRWLSPSLELAQKLNSAPVELRDQWLTQWIDSTGYEDFLHRGTVPEVFMGPFLEELGEPRRSFLAALAVPGPSLPIGAATELLRSLSSDLPLEDLLVRDVTAIRQGSFEFIGAGVCEFLKDSLPENSYPPLARLAGEVLVRHGRPRTAAALFVAGSEANRARELLEDLAISPDPELIALLETLPKEFIQSSPVLVETLCRAWLASGCYRRAMGMAAFASGNAQHIVAAHARRRMGSYAAALAALARCDGPESFEQALLRGEIYRLTDDERGAAEAFASAKLLAVNSEEMARVGYQSALLELDAGRGAPTDWMAEDDRGFLSACFRSYVALREPDFVEAAAASQEAFALARTVPEQADVALDLLYVHFESGLWEAARHQARAALTLVEETEGDRAAGGILFTLAYLCADDGRFLQAREKINRLQHFYAANSDDRRQRELALLEAHLALAEGRHGQARQLADDVLHANFGSDIRQAAALVIDELEWIEGSATSVRSEAGSSRELIARHLLQRARCEGVVPAEMETGFNRTLAEWEIETIRGGPAPLPKATSGSEKLRLLRSLRGITRRIRRESLTAALKSLCEQTGVLPETPANDGQLNELEMMQRVASSEFPFDSLTDFSWRFATRNRLGRWTELGSLAPLDAAELDREMEKPGLDWTRCDDHSLLHVQGFQHWSAPSRYALTELFRLRAENHYLRRAAEQDESQAIAERGTTPIDGWVGESPVMLGLMDRVRRVAAREVPVCILGESGTGKELVALAVHKLSVRRSRTFTPVNCAALPEQLVESQLFGHVRGAFTGADRDRMGLIEATEGGTLFLDEIGELPLPIQAKLLRFLQEKEFRPVGDTARRQADVRVLAATNRKLEQAVDDGTFREDLYYRINVLDVRIPPLRERGSDVLLLAHHFLDQECQRQRVGPARLSEEVELVLSSYRWPGNVRELQNTIRAAHAIAGDARRVELVHLPERLQGVLVVRGPAGSYFEELDKFRRTLIEGSLAQAAGNQNQAAKLLGMSRQALAYQIRELGIHLK